MTCPSATPGMPHFGNGPSPKPKPPPSTICSSAVTTSVDDGVRMSPVPRKMDASVLSSQISQAPENNTVA